MKKSKESSRRRFLKEGAALAGFAVGAIQPASGQTRAWKPPDYGMPSRFAGGKHAWYEPSPYLLSSSASCPIEDSQGIITPSALHFMISHGNAPPDIDPRQHRLLIHGMVDRPLIFTMEELKRLPSVSRIHFIECGSNTSPILSAKNAKTAQDACGRTSCSEWTGVLLSLLLKEVGVQKAAKWVVGEGAESISWTKSTSIERAMDDAMVAYGQNGEPIRPEQGFPLRLLVPGCAGDNSVKWLRRIQVGDRPYMSPRDCSAAAPRKDGVSILIDPQFGAKSIITFPSGEQQLPGRGFYEITGIAWSGAGAVRRVEVSTDGGRTWKDAELQQPIHRKAWTRFRFPWNWNGEECTLQSRCTDEGGEVQPTIAEIARVWGTTVDEWRRADWSTAPTFFNPIQPWHVTREGRVHNVLFL